MSIKEIIMSIQEFTAEDLKVIAVKTAFRTIPYTGGITADVIGIAATNRKIDEVRADIPTIVDNHLAVRHSV